MICTYSLQKFHSIITDISASNISVKLYGKCSETFSGSHAGFDVPPNNTLQIKLVALTGVGEIYCTEGIKFENVEAIESAKNILNSLNIIDTELFLDGASGVITIS